MAKYRKKPVVIEAVQYLEKRKPVHGMCVNERCAYWKFDHVHTIHDNQPIHLEIGDWVVPEPNGINFYPIKTDIFEKTYEKESD